MSDFEKGLPSRKEIAELTDLREEAFRAITEMREQGRELEQRLGELDTNGIPYIYEKTEFDRLEEISTDISRVSALLTELLQKFIALRMIKPTQAEAADLTLYLAELSSLLKDVEDTQPIGPIIARSLDAGSLDIYREDSLEASKPGAHWLDKFAATAFILKEIITGYQRRRPELFIK